MSDQAIKDEIIDPMQQLFLPPKDMPDEWQRQALRQYMDALRTFSREDLQAAWKSVRDAATARSWPPIAAFVRAAWAARKARKEGAGEAEGAPKAPRHRHDMDGWRAHFRENWNHVKYTPLAKEAAREGYALLLKSAILDGVPLAKIRPAELNARCERARRLSDKIADNENFPSQGECSQMWTNLLVHRAEVEAEIERAHGHGPHMPAIPAFEYPYEITALKGPPAYQMDRMF